MPQIQKPSTDSQLSQIDFTPIRKEIPMYEGFIMIILIPFLNGLLILVAGLLFIRLMRHLYARYRKINEKAYDFAYTQIYAIQWYPDIIDKSTDNYDIVVHAIDDKIKEIQFHDKIHSEILYFRIKHEVPNTFFLYENCDFVVEPVDISETTFPKDNKKV